MTRFRFAVVFSVFAVAIAARGQTPGTASGGSKTELPVEMTAQQDRQRLMDLLGIKELRQGANGSNRNAPNYANYDESKANPYPDLPDPLIMKDGRKVDSADMWWKERRPEIVEDFDREIYGRTPKQTPKVLWEVVGVTEETVASIPVVVKKLVGRVDNSSFPAITVEIQLTLTTPAKATAPVPVVLEFGFGAFPGRGPRPGAAATKGDAKAQTAKAANKAESAAATKGANPPARPPMFAGPPSRQQVLEKGWAYAVIVPNSVQADNGAGLTKGIIGLCNQGKPRRVDDWGVLKAWGWGASRAIDYFETDKAVDSKRVGVFGHSRYGKAAVVAMAYDPRIAIAFVSSSGEGGLKLHRRNWGELVENVAALNEYHWMSGTFLKYAGPLTWKDMPIDSHELIALCAPRPVFIGAGATEGDGWIDARGSFMAGVGASPVYRLLGKRGLETTEYPSPEAALIEGEIGFRRHTAGHTPGPNWPTFLKFAERYLGTTNGETKN